MDSFIEQIVVKKSEARDNLKRAGIMAGGMALCLTFGTLAMLIFALSMIFIFLCFGTVWLTWFFIQGTFIEYEYIVTNNEMDIDKIMARKKRKRLITIRIDKAEDWGVYAAGKDTDAQVTVQAHDCGYTNLWYIVTRHEKFGKTVVYFSPGRAVLEVMNKHVPYALRKKELKEQEKADENEIETEEAVENKD
ncbi:MAG: hypothetical protein LBC82_02895 [Oscillospiraceae bacterium]|nr:hypothetical protein [Oscillospiraceae bacterium]